MWNSHPGPWSEGSTEKPVFCKFVLGQVTGHARTQDFQVSFRSRNMSQHQPTSLLLCSHLDPTCFWSGCGKQFLLFHMLICTIKKTFHSDDKWFDFLRKAADGEICGLPLWLIEWGSLYVKEGWLKCVNSTGTVRRDSKFCFGLTEFIVSNSFLHCRFFIFVWIHDWIIICTT